MIITISGDVGSGKSTVAGIISKELKLKYYSTGMMFRKLANDMQLSLQELSELAEKDPRIDKRIDNYQKKLGASEDNFILEGRLGFHFIPESVKVYLKAEPEEAGRRIFTHNRADEKYKSMEEAVKKIKERRLSENKRYKTLYAIDVEDESNYDLIVDTNNVSAEQAAEKIIKHLKNI